MLFGAGVAWTADDFIQVATQLLAHNPGGAGQIAAEVALGFVKLAFTAPMFRMAQIEWARVGAQPLPHPRNLAVPAILLGGALVLNTLVQNALQNWGWFGSGQDNSKQPKGQPDGKQATPTPAPTEPPLRSGQPN
jgi:hypothetical protein